MIARLKPYWLHVYLLVYTPTLLLADSQTTALWQQWILGLLTFAALACAVTAYADIAVPAPGTSPRIDAIKKAGALRVAVLANAPWLVENTTGSGEGRT